MTKIVAPVGAVTEVSAGVARITLPVADGISPIPDPGVSWAATTGFTAGDRIKVAAGAPWGDVVYEALNSDTTGGTEPDWVYPTTLLLWPEVVDGGVGWALVGAVGGAPLGLLSIYLDGLFDGSEATLVVPQNVDPHGDLGSTATFSRSAGPAHSGTVTAALTLTLDNWQASGTQSIITARLTNDGTGGYGVPTLGAEVVNAADWAAVWNDAAGALNEVVFETWDGGTNVYIANLPLPAATALSALTDVSLASLAADDTLQYNGSLWVNSKRRWEPVTFDPGGGPEIVFTATDIVMTWETY